MNDKILLDIGNKLQLKREELNLSQNCVSKKLKLKESYIKALEEGDFETIKSKTYLVGYVKQYSQLLNEQEVVDLINGAVAQNENNLSAPDGFINNANLTKPSKTLILCSLIIVAIFYWFGV